MTHYAKMKWLLIALGFLALTGCSPTKALNAMVPSSSYALHTGVHYGQHARQRMDIYVPKMTDVRSEVVVFVYGGAWEEGDKRDFEFVGQAFSRLGYITVVPNYRLYPEVEFPAFIEDIALAIAQLPPRLERLGIHEPQGRHVILAGHSAGAHTVALLAADPAYLREQGATDTALVALIGLSGPYDLPLEHERVQDKFTRVEGDEANPIALAHANMPPTLLIHGEADVVAKPEHAERFAEQLSNKGVVVDLHTYPRRRHVDIIASLASPLRFWSPAYADIQRFLQRDELKSTSFGQTQIFESGITEHVE